MSNNLKIAYLLGTFPQLTQTFVNREIFWVGEQGIETHIFSLYNPKSLPDDKLAKLLLPKAHYSPYISWGIIKAQIYYFLRSPYRYMRALVRSILYTYREPVMLFRGLVNFPKSVFFARQMQDLKIDHIHTHFIMLASVSASIAAILLDITYSFTGHAVGLFKRNQFSIRHQLKDASRVITISKYHRDYIANLCPEIDIDDIDIVHCGLDTDQFQQGSNQADNGLIRILSIGRLIEKKGFDYLIDACAIIAKAGLPFQCNIVGDGPLQEELQSRINQYGLQKNVTLLGPLNQSEVLDIYQNSDLFVLACVVAENGNRDGLPVVLIEAMSCEIPVITTPVTGIPDLAENGQTCILVEERNAVDLAKSIEKLIRDKNLREHLGKQGRKKIIEDFRIQTSTARLVNIFQSVVNSRGIQN